MHTSAPHAQLGLDHGPGLMRLALRLAGTDDAEDLVQATWLRALEHDGPVRHRRAWLHRVLVNERNMKVRGTIRRDEREKTTPPEDGPIDVEQVVHSLEVARVVQDLVEQLDEDLKLVVRERYFEGSSAADIARRHAIPAGTVRWRLKSGLDQLRDQLDARYGGRRALWAGGLLPGALSPTLGTGTASPGATAGGTSSAAGKGFSAMSVKLIAAATILVVGTASTAAVMSSNDEDERSTETVAATALPSSDSRAVAQPNEVESIWPEERAKSSWDRLRNRILAAHHDDDHDHDHDHDAAEPCEDRPHLGGCTQMECIQSMTAQIMEMVQGCNEFMGDAPADLALTAKVIGAPDIGSVVESVELTTGEEAPAELRECLTEAMYTLDLGPTDTDFDQEIKLMLGHQRLSAEDFGDGITMIMPSGGKLADQMQHAEITLPPGGELEFDEETAAQIAKLLGEHGEGEVSMLSVETSMDVESDG